MASILRLTAAEADTELREMRAALLKKVADTDKQGFDAPATQRRIAALNRAISSLAAEPMQGKLLTGQPTAYERPRID